MSLIGSLGIKKVALDMLKMLVPDLLAEALSLKSLKNLILNKKGGDDGKMDEASDLSKKEAYFQASVVVDSEEGCSGHSLKIARFLNTLSGVQREKFQLIVGAMAQTDVIIKRAQEVTDKQGNKKTIHPEQKVNLGIKFLKSFGRLSQDEMKEVTQANSDIFKPKAQTLGEEIKEKLADESSELQQKMLEMRFRMKTYRDDHKPNKFIKTLRKFF